MFYIYRGLYPPLAHSFNHFNLLHFFSQMHCDRFDWNYFLLCKFNVKINVYSCSCSVRFHYTCVDIYIYINLAYHVAAVTLPFQYRLNDAKCVCVRFFFSSKKYHGNQLLMPCTTAMHAYLLHTESRNGFIYIYKDVCSWVWKFN